MFIAAVYVYIPMAGSGARSSGENGSDIRVLAKKILIHPERSKDAGKRVVNHPKMLMERV